MRFALLVVLAALAGCGSAAVVPGEDSAHVSGPVVFGKLDGVTQSSYIPFSSTSGSPTIATEAYVQSQIVPHGADAGLKVYRTGGGELYDDDRLPDVLVVDGTKDFSITATLALTQSAFRRFWFVNRSATYDIHVSTDAGSYSVAGPMSTALILANRDGWEVISVAPYAAPKFLHN